VSQGSPQGRLGKEEDSHHCEVEADNLLTRSQHPFLEAARRSLLPARCAAPTQVVELPEDEEDQAQPTQQGHQAQGAPQVGGSRGAIAHEGFEGPVIRVGIVGARALRHGRPGSPSEVGIQSLELPLVMDVAGGQARRGLHAHEVALPFTSLRAIGSCFRTCECKDVHALVVAVLLQEALQFLAHLQRLTGRQCLKGLAIALLGEGIAADFGQSVQILRCVVRTQIGTVTPQRPVLHEPILEEDLLPALDVIAREQRLPGGIHDLGGNGRGTLVGLHCDQGQQ